MITLMQQKMNWMNYLTIGISLLLFTITGCKEQVDYAVKSKWIYINTTDSSIAYFPDRPNFNLEGQDTVEFETIIEGDKETNPTNLGSPLKPSVIFYGNNLCDTLSNQNKLLWDVSNYEIKTIGRNDFEYVFRFTDENISKAKRCR
ncbi:MAG: hypothetical protein VXX63_07755 [Bacteroidota bacterium]|nr:hypothetical protein [Bacteroidota bacterium]